MRKLYILACLFLPAAVFGTPLGYTFHYTLTSETDVITFSLPQRPVPLESCAYTTNCFSVTAENLTVNGDTLPDGIVSFYTPASKGGITILEGDTLLVNNDGPDTMQLFSGLLSEPVLKAFSNLQLIEEPFGGPAMHEAFILNADAPEPGTLYLLFPSILIGGALVGRASVRKSSRASSQLV
jgi:hypothetical protein